MNPFFPLVLGRRYLSSNHGPGRGISCNSVPPSLVIAFSADLLAGGYFGREPANGSSPAPAPFPIAEMHGSLIGAAFRLPFAAVSGAACSAARYPATGTTYFETSGVPTAFLDLGSGGPTYSSISCCGAGFAGGAFPTQQVEFLEGQQQQP